MSDVNRGYGNGQRYGTPVNQPSQNNSNHTVMSHPEQPYNNIHPRTMSYSFNPTNNISHGSNDLVSNISKLAINTSSQPSQSDLNTTANEFVPKLTPPSRPLHGNVQQFDYNSGGTPKSMYSFARGQPVLPPGSPQMSMRGRGRMPSSPPLHLSPGQAPHSIDAGAHHSQLRRPDVSHQPMQHSTSQQQDLVQVQENYGGTTYFYNQDEYMQPALRQTFPNYSVYVGMPTHLAHMKQTSDASGLFVGDEIKSQLLEKQAAILSEVEGITDLPTEVDNFVHLVPLENTSSEMREHYNYPCTTYKAVNRKNGLTYCLHRIHGFKLTTQSMDTIAKWKEISSPNIVQLRQVFTTKTFGDNSLVFVYDYHTCSEVMLTKLLNNPARNMGSNGYSSPFNVNGSARPFSAGKAGSRKVISGQLPEGTLWSYAIQLINALRVVHHHNLSVNGLPSKNILISYKDRLRINCVGILDVIAYDRSLINAGPALSHLQKKDLHSLGIILLALSCNSPLAFRPENFARSLDILSSGNYSQNLVKLIKCLISAIDPLTGNPSAIQVDDLLPMVSSQVFSELNSQSLRYDFMENELSKSLENGRLFRLQAKLNTILERSELNMDGQWSETGDRYILKLFRDYVYHQTAENGTPWIDMAHVVTALNKLDAGVPEKLCLSSSDETAIIVVSYAELKRCFESAFSDIVQASLSAYNA